MLEYSILLDKDEKRAIKEEFLTFFESVYHQKLDEPSWEHQFINSPYEDTPLFIVKEDNKIVGSALMIRQKMQINNEILDYFLFTTSAIHEDHRTKGIYPELLKRQKEYAKNQNASFIFAFPNEIAQPVLKLFGRFKNLKKLELGIATLADLDFTNLKNTFAIDDKIMQWRFEHKPYQFVLYKNHVLIVKEFEKTLDLLAVYPKEIFDKYDIEYKTYTENTQVLTNLEYITDARREGIPTKLSLQPTYFGINVLNELFSEGIVPINLLMSDVF